jgi:hypothetical protein
MEIPGRAVRVSITMDEGLLARLDKAAGAEGETRSGYIAQAVRERLARPGRADRPTAPSTAARSYGAPRRPRRGGGAGRRIERDFRIDPMVQDFRKVIKAAKRTPRRAVPSPAASEPGCSTASSAIAPEPPSFLPAAHCKSVTA